MMPQQNSIIHTISSRIHNELAEFGDAEIIAFIQPLLVEPRSLQLLWDYDLSALTVLQGHIVLEDGISATRIVYCEQGFGPAHPWGLVSLREDAPNMGQDSAWFRSFLDAFFDSFASTRLHIYQVVATHMNGSVEVLSGQVSWDEAWADVTRLRVSNPVSHYDVVTLRYQRS